MVVPLFIIIIIFCPLKRKTVACLKSKFLLIVMDIAKSKPVVSLL